MEVKIEDVAKLAGVSVTTVSRVMNNYVHVSEKTKKKVNDAIEELNYYPSQIARSLYRRRSEIIGVIVQDVSHNYYGKLVKEIEDLLSKMNYKVLLCNTNDEISSEREYLKMLQGHRVDGVIVASHTLDKEAYEEIQMPMVALDRYLGDNIPVVASDHLNGGIIAADELITSGCDNIVQVVGSTRLKKPTDDKHTVFKSRIESKGKICHNIEIPLGLFDFESYREIAKQLFAKYPEVDGVFAADDIACAVLKEALDLNIEIPSQLKIIGYDGNISSEIITPSITTIAQQIDLIAKEAVKLIIGQIEKNEEYIGMHKIPVNLIRRETTV